MIKKNEPLYLHDGAQNSQWWSLWRWWVVVEVVQQNGGGVQWRWCNRTMVHGGAQNGGGGRCRWWWWWWVRGVGHGS